MVESQPEEWSVLVLVPQQHHWFTGIPYVGWLVSGWAVMFGQDTGADIGGEIATMMEDCDEL